VVQSFLNHEDTKSQSGTKNFGTHFYIDMQHTVYELVEKYQLLPHPEGGYYKETYRSNELIAHEALPQRFSGGRQYSTAIYFLLEQGNFSSFYRIQCDECWHFYTGDPLLVHVIHPDGNYQLINKGEMFQAMVPAGSWFASETAPGGQFSFVGCTVAPGFDFADFELAKAMELSKQFPEMKALINRLCRQ
jgi:predicted cupin superfamily sugar epimerase